MLREQPERIADMAAGLSVATAGSAWLADLDHMISIVAALVAIVAGCCAAVFHISRTLELRRKAKKED